MTYRSPSEAPAVCRCGVCHPTPAGAGQRLTEAGNPGGGAARPPAAPSPGTGRHHMETAPLIPMFRARQAAGLPIVGPDLWDVASSEMRGGAA